MCTQHHGKQSWIHARGVGRDLPSITGILPEFGQTATQTQDVRTKTEMKFMQPSSLRIGRVTEYTSVIVGHYASQIIVVSLHLRLNGHDKSDEHVAVII